MLVVASLAAGAATAAPRMFVGIQDEFALRWRPDRQAMLNVAWHANATVVRTWVEWWKVAPTRPANPTDPFDPAYRLTDIDDLVRAAQMRGMEILLTFWGTPPWANEDAGRNRPPTNLDDLRQFAQAIAGRYSGRYVGFPFVRFYSIWNEPNVEQFLTPQFDAEGRSVGPELYAGLYRAGYAGIKIGNPLGLVGIGETSSWGRDFVSAGPGQQTHSPGTFARLLSEVRPRLPFDAWAHHPYPTSPNLPPRQRVRWPNVTLGRLDRFELALRRWFGRREVPIWITEYGYQTRPQVEDGVSYRDQALYLEDALGMVTANPDVQMFVWFVLRDDPSGPWPSGLITQNNRPKPAFRVFARAAKALDARDAIVAVRPGKFPVVHVSARDVSYYSGVGAPVWVHYRVLDGSKLVKSRWAGARIGLDDWLLVRLRFRPRKGHTYVVRLAGADVHGNKVRRRLILFAR